ncbi:MAG TPA: hypothetical protein QF564_32005 [Pirellulaceae bacterium]|jgi:hypothetical protein|nr:hypothetical protein [Pirellulaceae bacterium]
MPKSTKQGRAGKSDPEFPLYAHPLGYWSKRVNGQIKHFGRWGRVVDGRLTPLPYEQGWQEALHVFKATLTPPQRHDR